MTFEEWTRSCNITGELAELIIFPEWTEWRKRIEEVLSHMDFGEGINNSFNDLLKLAKIDNEVSRAKKELTNCKRKHQLEKDFKNYDICDDETHETYIESEYEDIVSAEASHYFIRHREITFSIELWLNIRDWIRNVVHDYDYDKNKVDDCIDYWLNQPQFSQLKKQALSDAKKKQLNKDFKYDE